jgi:hypothetical protein
MGYLPPALMMVAFATLWFSASTRAVSKLSSDGQSPFDFVQSDFIKSNDSQSNYMRINHFWNKRVKRQSTLPMEVNHLGFYPTDCHSTPLVSRFVEIGACYQVDDYSSYRLYQSMFVLYSKSSCENEIKRTDLPTNPTPGQCHFFQSGDRTFALKIFHPWGLDRINQRNLPLCV